MPCQIQKRNVDASAPASPALDPEIPAKILPQSKAWSKLAGEKRGVQECSQECGRTGLLKVKANMFLLSMFPKPKIIYWWSSRLIKLK
jgi:hypothetical protein